MDYPPGTIGVLTANLARYSQFSKSLEALYRPPGTQIVWVEGLWVANALNRIIAAMRPESTFLMILSDDHRFAPDLLLRMLAHDVDIVAPLCALRSPPFRPCCFHEVAPETYAYYTWKELEGRRGLVSVDTLGCAGGIVRRRVLEAIGTPVFVGLAGTHPQEDLYSFARMRNAGFKLHVDLDTRIEHLTAMSVCPEPLDDGTWGMRLWSNVDLCILPAYDPPDTLVRESESK
jgi:hypothetical protein